MAALKTALFPCFLQFFVACAEPQTQTARPGENITLSCRAPSSNIGAVEWTRPDLQQYVFFMRGKAPLTQDQHPSFKNRVQLHNSELQDGDLSLILKNVSSNDKGMYECRYKERNMRSKRTAIMGEPIETIILKIDDVCNTSGHTVRRHTAIILPAISLVGIIILAGLLSLKNLKKKPYQPADVGPQETQRSESKTMFNIQV